MTYRDLAQQQLLDAVSLMMLQRMEESSNGRLPHGFMQEMIDLVQNTGGFQVTRGILNHQVRLMNAKCLQSGYGSLQGVLLEPPAKTSGSSTISSLTTASRGGAPGHGAPPGGGGGGGVLLDGVVQVQPIVGRPKGSTKFKEAKEKSATRSATHEIIKRLQKERAIARGDGKSRLPPGSIKRVVQRVAVEFGVKPSTICLKSIRNKLSEDATEYSYDYSSCIYKPLCLRGPKSPLLEVEQYVIPLILQLARIGEPLSPDDFIDFMNSLIENTPHQESLIKFKTKFCSFFYNNKNDQHDTDDSTVPIGCVGKGYYNGFMSRYAHIFAVTKGKRFQHDRSKWEYPELLEEMFDAAYETFVEAGIADRAPDGECFYFQADGSMGDKDNHFGEPSNIRINQPDFLLFADETGINTNQRKDGSNKKVIAGHGCEPALVSNSADHRATVLPFTAATGEPVICVVIFASDSQHTPPLWHYGTDLFATPILVEDSKNKIDMTDKQNYGEGKYLPGGPVCNFRGKEIPTLTFTSPSGSVTSEILVSVLQYLDKIDVFNRRRGEGMKLCVIVDGHESRLKLEFVDYINNNDHKWFFNFGVPYLTHHWQVGDSNAQNGRFKKYFYKAKDSLMKRKATVGITQKLDATDIMPLINIAWHQSFAETEGCKKAVANRGWYPPTKKLLSHPKILEMYEARKLFTTAGGGGGATATTTGTTCSTTGTSTTTPPSSTRTLPQPIIAANPANLNLSTGASARHVDEIFSAEAQKESFGRRQAAFAQGVNIKEVLANAKVSSGNNVWNARNFSCNFTPLHEELSSRKQKEIQDAAEKQLKEYAQWVKRRAEVHANKKPVEKWSSKECSVYLQYKRKEGDPSMPRTVKERRQRCMELAGRSSPHPPPLPAGGVANV